MLKTNGAFGRDGRGRTISGKGEQRRDGATMMRAWRPRGGIEATSSMDSAMAGQGCVKVGGLQKPG